MQLTEVRIHLCGAGLGRLKAYCSLTFDQTFVVRDVKLVEGNEELFLAMPSRKICDRCNRCGEKNHLRARFCNQCGGRLDETRALRPHSNSRGRPKLYADLAHPIHPGCRAKIEQEVLAAYHDEVRKSAAPGYIRKHLDPDDLDLYDVPQQASAENVVFHPISTAIH
jgi:stage V sporulation protein G